MNTDESESKDVLIASSKSTVEHKMAGEVPDGEECFWSVHGTPRQTEPGQRVWFARDGRLFASGEITRVEDGRIWFAPLQPEDRDAPEDPPSRGFMYFEGVLPQDNSAGASLSEVMSQITENDNDH